MTLVIARSLPISQGSVVCSTTDLLETAGDPFCKVLARWSSRLVNIPLFKYTNLIEVANETREVAGDEAGVTECLPDEAVQMRQVEDCDGGG
jgi:hypothetical protein